MCCFRSAEREGTRAEPPTRPQGAADPRQPKRAAASQESLLEFPVAFHRSLLDENKIEQYQERTCKQDKSVGVWAFVFNQLNTYFGSDGKQFSPGFQGGLPAPVTPAEDPHLPITVLSPQRTEPYSFFFGLDKLYITLYFH